MKLTFKVTALLIVMLAAAAVASADSVSLTLNNGGSDVMGGVYVGPYNFTNTGNGQSLQLICDDFKDEVYVGESWKATTTTVSSLNNVMFTGSTQYQEIAWLVGQMDANLGNAQTVGDIQWAIWDIFDPGIREVTPMALSAAKTRRTSATGSVRPRRPAGLAPATIRTLLFTRR